MIKSLLNFRFAIAILAAGLVLTLTSLAQTRPVTMPVTLFDLFRQSDAIYEARFARTEEGEVIRQVDDYQVVKTIKHFDIYSTVKGQHSKFFELADDEYRYSNSQPGKYLMASTDSDVENTYGLRSGDSVLLFLRYAADGKTLELADDEEGLKKLSSDDVAVYEQRIKELASMMASGKPKPEQVIEWMVRCAEEPATRWEATFELVKGFERLDYQEKQRKAAKDKQEDKKVVIVTDEIDTLDSSAFARAMTVEQKGKMANILLDRKPAADGARTLVHGDRELIDLVSHWGDPRLAGFLLDQLKTKDLTDYRRSETMNLIAQILGDPRVVTLASRYNQAYRDEAIASELFKDAPSIANANSFSDTSTGPDYKKLRGSIIVKFIKSADAIVASKSYIGN